MVTPVSSTSFSPPSFETAPPAAEQPRAAGPTSSDPVVQSRSEVVTPKEVSFAYDSGLDMYTQTVTDARTGEVIRQTPTPEELSFTRAFRSMVGMMFDVAV